MATPLITQTGYGYQLGGQGQYYTNYADALAALNASQQGTTSGSLNAGTGSALTPSQQYALDVENARKAALDQAGLSGAQTTRDTAATNYQNFQWHDLAQVMKEASDRLGLTGISKQIGDLTSQAYKQQNVLDELPDTILSGAKDVGIAQNQLDLRSAVESRPIVKNIRDLLQSVSVLGGVYDRGFQQVQTEAQLTGQQDQNKFSQLGTAYNIANDSYNSAEGLFGTLFSNLTAGLTTPQQRESLDLQRQNLTQDAAQSAATLAEQRRQFDQTQNPDPNSLAAKLLQSQISNNLYHAGSGSSGGGLSDLLGSLAGGATTQTKSTAATKTIGGVAIPQRWQSPTDAAAYLATLRNQGKLTDTIYRNVIANISNVFTRGRVSSQINQLMSRL